MLDCHCLGEAEEECEEGQEQVELHNLRLYRIDLNLILSDFLIPQILTCNGIVLSFWEGSGLD
jgi:hypothetical protein